MKERTAEQTRLIHELLRELPMLENKAMRGAAKDTK